jgi:hypothetical protein
MNTLFKRPASSADIQFVARCLWALDPNRHLFEGDFRDHARALLKRMLCCWRDRDVPEMCADEIVQIADTFPCYAPSKGVDDHWSARSEMFEAVTSDNVNRLIALMSTGVDLDWEFRTGDSLRKRLLSNSGITAACRDFIAKQQKTNRKTQ